MKITAAPIISEQWWVVSTFSMDDAEVEETEADPESFKVLIKPLSGIEMIDMRTNVYEKPSGRMAFNGQGMKKALQMGLVDWLNLYDADGAEVLFSVENAYKRLAFDVLEAIAYQIIGRSSIPEDARKKS